MRYLAAMVLVPVAIVADLLSVLFTLSLFALIFWIEEGRPFPLTVAMMAFLS